jgi:hypothetical protein
MARVKSATRRMGRSSLGKHRHALFVASAAGHAGHHKREEIQ